MVRQEGGQIEVASSEIKNTTMMVRVEQAGEGVNRCKVGDLIVYLRCAQMYFRAGVHRGVVHNDDVVCVVTDYDPKSLEVKGEERYARLEREQRAEGIDPFAPTGLVVPAHLSRQ